MALGAICGILRTECFSSVVTGAAELAFIVVFHRDGVCAFLHLEETRLMAIRALESCICVSLAIKYDLAGTLFRRIPRSCQMAPRKRKQPMPALLPLRERVRIIFSFVVSPPFIVSLS